MGIQFWLIVIAIVVVIYAIRYIIKKVVYTGADAISNAYKRKKNQENSDNTENLSDRYKK